MILYHKILGYARFIFHKKYKLNLEIFTLESAKVNDYNLYYVFKGVSNK